MIDRQPPRNERAHRDEDDEKVMAKGTVTDSLRAAMKRYDAEMERLILFSLKLEIEALLQNEEQMLTLLQFDRFCRKIPKRHRRRFVNLREGNGLKNEVPCHRIAALFDAMDLDGEEPPETHSVPRDATGSEP